MVTFNTLSSSSSDTLNRTSNTLASSLARLSSGNRINRASEDVASLAVGTALSGEVATLRSALGNASQGTSLLQVADGGLSQQVDILQRQKALATQASSGQLDDASRSALNQEFQALSEELNRIAATTNFNGVALLDGSSAQAGAALNFTVGSDANDSISVAITDTSTTTVFGGATVDIATQTSATAALSTIDDALTAVTSTRASVGALQSRFDAADATIRSAINNQEAARSTLLDTDIGAESTATAAALVQQQAAIATQAQTKKLGSGLLRLIG